MKFRVIIRSAANKVEVATGYVVDIHTFEGMPRHECQLACPSCGGVHRWSMKDAMLTSILEGEHVAGDLPALDPPEAQAVSRPGLRQRIA